MINIESNYTLALNVNHTQMIDRFSVIIAVHLVFDLSGTH